MATLLDMVQDILSAMDSDEVNSVDDTVESEQVARVIKTVYNDLITRIEFPETYDMFELNASGTSTKPTLMTKPTSIRTIKWIKYNCATLTDTDPQYKQLKELTVTDFFDRMYLQDLSATEVLSFDHTIGSDSLTVLYVNNKAPEYWCSYDDYTLLFDSYDATVDSTLQKNKTICYGLKAPSAFSMTNTWEPDLDEINKQILFQEAKALAFAELKQMTHAKAERSARDQKIHLQRRFPSPIETANYGRK